MPSNKTIPTLKETVDALKNLRFEADRIHGALLKHLGATSNTFESRERSYTRRHSAVQDHELHALLSKMRLAVDELQRALG
jgi:hypothetical protein